MAPPSHILTDPRYARLLRRAVRALLRWERAYTAERATRRNPARFAFAARRSSIPRASDMARAVEAMRAQGADALASRADYPPHEAWHWTAQGRKLRASFGPERGLP